MYKRSCKLPKNHSFFLFGARGTGKTHLLRNSPFPKKTHWIDLLNQRVEDRYRSNPDTLYDECRTNSFDWVIIDEVQKHPKILDTVHRILEASDFTPPCFALTGSSARKLKHGGANLLAGRAFVRNLFPLTHEEIGESFHYRNRFKFWLSSENFLP